MALIRIATPFNIDLDFETAEFYKRLSAYIIDFATLLLYFISMKYVYYGGFYTDENVLQSHVGVDILTISFPMLLYSLVSEVLLHGQTLGKKIMHIRVVSLQGGEPELGQYLVRWMFKVFEWPFMFGYTFFSRENIIVYVIITGLLGIIAAITIAVTKKGQRLGDVAANTVVVNTSLSLSVTDTIFMDIAKEGYKVQFPEVLKLSDRDINTIKTVMNHFYKTHNAETCRRVALKVQNVLHLNTELDTIPLLEKLLSDYNYLATKE